MATRTANVMARVEPDVKEQAEGILDQLADQRERQDADEIGRGRHDEKI